MPFTFSYLVIEIGAQQILHRINAFIQQHIINAILRQHFQRQRARVRTDDCDFVFRISRFQPARQRDGTDHIGRAGVRVLSINCQANEARVGLVDAPHRLLQRESLCAGVQNRRLKTIAPAGLREQQRPRGRLDGRIFLGQFLIRLRRGIGRDEQHVELFVQRFNHRYRVFNSSVSSVMRSGSRSG